MLLLALDPFLLGLQFADLALLLLQLADLALLLFFFIRGLKAFEVV